MRSAQLSREARRAYTNTRRPGPRAALATGARWPGSRRRMVRHHGNNECLSPPPTEHLGFSPTRPIVYVPLAGQTGMLFDHLSGKFGRRSSQVSVSFVVLSFQMPTET